MPPKVQLTKQEEEEGLWLFGYGFELSTQFLLSFKPQQQYTDMIHTTGVSSGNLHHTLVCQFSSLSIIISLSICIKGANLLVLD